MILSAPLRFCALALATTLGIGCVPFGLGGEVGSTRLAFDEAVYFELRGVDEATSLPFHRIELWLMPMTNSCEQFPLLLDELSELRAGIGEGMDPNDYCDQWEQTFESYLGLDEFWLAQFRLKALPREDSIAITTTYQFHDEASEELADGPNYDADVGLYGVPDFDACAEEFSGDEVDDEYRPELFTAAGGEAVLEEYTEDEELKILLEPTIDDQGRGRLSGRSTPSFCPEADTWPVEFGLGR